MDVNYILIKGNKHFKCHSLAEMAIYFSLSVTSNGSVICDGYHDTMSYSKEWSHEDIITDFIRESTAQAKYNDVRRVERNYTKGVHKARKEAHNGNSNSTRHL